MVFYDERVITGVNLAFTFFFFLTQKIRFRDIWEGIHRLPSATFVFSLRDTTVSGFSAQFDVRQDCENGDEREVNVVTTVKRGHEVSLLKSHLQLIVLERKPLVLEQFVFILDRFRSCDGSRT